MNEFGASARSAACKIVGFYERGFKPPRDGV